MNIAYFIGIDIGTQGARVVLLDNRGAMLGAKEEVFPINDNSREEQSPAQWWASCFHSLRELCTEMKAIIDLKRVKAIAVTSTSGTIIPLDIHHCPLHNAIMYSDSRSVKEAQLCKEIAINVGSRGYTAFNASSGLPKMLWFINNFPDKVPVIHKFIHASDFITGKLSGNYRVTDYTNALKSGFDLHNLVWPEYVTTHLGLRKEWLQQVVAPGTPVGYLKRCLINELGLSAEVIVTAGMTDGCASQVASSAINLGDWNTTIGTTLVIKGVTTREIADASGALYCHRHPDGWWMPGGASNTGADWVSRLFKEKNIGQLTKEASQLIPTPYLAWPLLQTGERFPFMAPQATGFAPEDLTTAELFTAYLEGVAYIERYAFETIKARSGESVKQVFTAGGGSSNNVWLTIRSAVLNIPVIKMKHGSGAVGAAILAASKTYFSSIVSAAQSMTAEEKRILPGQSLVLHYEKNYQAFVDTLKQKGYI